MKALLAAILVIGTTGCATTGQYQARVDSWRGRDSRDLLASWGQPDEIEKQSNGDTILLYSRLKHEPYTYGESDRTLASGSGHRGPIYVRCATYFEATSQNVIKSVMFRGDQCRWKD